MRQLELAAVAAFVDDGSAPAETTSAGSAVVFEDSGTNAIEVVNETLHAQRSAPSPDACFHPSLARERALGWVQAWHDAFVAAWPGPLDDPSEAQHWEVACGRHADQEPPCPVASPKDEVGRTPSSIYHFKPMPCDVRQVVTFWPKAVGPDCF